VTKPPKPVTLPPKPATFPEWPFPEWAAKAFKTKPANIAPSKIIEKGKKTLDLDDAHWASDLLKRYNQRQATVTKVAGKNRLWMWVAGTIILGSSIGAIIGFFA
jgi:hypothetical protein